MELTSAEIRVLGCLVEKQRTTPDQYPLSLNALRLACNQATSREPVVDYDEATIREALERLGRRRLTRLASAGRATKYRHLLPDTLGLQPDELAVLAVLMLRGPQTLNAIHARTERLHSFAEEAALRDTLARLEQQGYTRLLERRPGEREARYTHLILEDGEEPAAAPPAGFSATLQQRVEALEREVAELRSQLMADTPTA